MIKRFGKRAALVAGSAVLMTTLMVGAAFAVDPSPDPDVMTTLNDATGSLKVTLVAVLAIGLAIGVVIFAIRRGWKFIRGFAR